jgi:hypothetical protein
MQARALACAVAIGSTPLRQPLNPSSYFTLFQLLLT